MINTIKSISGASGGEIRALQRALSDPSNKWNWYEVAKRGYNLNELTEIAREHGIKSLDPVKAGYDEAI